MIFLCGLDEAGRGPLAGPVAAGAVVLPPDFPVDILNDSKKLSEKKREEAEKIIKERACWGISFVDNETIDRINILQASLYAMRLAFEMLQIKFPAWATETYPDFSGSIDIQAVADGNKIPSLPVPCKCMIKADASVHEVMAASIIAKTGRDRLMKEYDKQYPEYGYARHKGYPTAEHKKICRKIGPSPIQRLSFKY